MEPFECPPAVGPNGDAPNGELRVFGVQTRWETPSTPSLIPRSQFTRPPGHVRGLAKRLELGAGAVKPVDNCGVIKVQKQSALPRKTAPTASPVSRKDPKWPEMACPTNPLYGELSVDGWRGNFDLQASSIGRRQSDGTLSHRHVRAQSHQGPTSPRSVALRGLHHRRSRSNMENQTPQNAPSLPNLHIPARTSSGPNSAGSLGSPTSRIPISQSRLRESPGSQKSGTPTPRRDKPAGASQRGRYHPPPDLGVQVPPLSAKIVAPDKTSPTLRSSRPRLPVSSASNSSDRPRVTDRFRPDSGPSPGERTRRRIPELQKIDFAERRTKIQQAITQNLESSERMRSRPRAASGEASRARSRTPSGANLEAPRQSSLPVLATKDQPRSSEMPRPGAEFTRSPVRSVSRNQWIPTVNEPSNGQFHPEEAGQTSNCESPHKDKQKSNAEEGESSNAGGEEGQNKAEYGTPSTPMTHPQLELQTPEMNSPTTAGASPSDSKGSSVFPPDSNTTTGLSLKIPNLEPSHGAPSTAATEFEGDESPILGKAKLPPVPGDVEQAILPPPVHSPPKGPILPAAERAQSPSTLGDTVNSCRSVSVESADGTVFAEDSLTAESPIGSIPIALHGVPTSAASFSPVSFKRVPVNTSAGNWSPKRVSTGQPPTIPGAVQTAQAAQTAPTSRPVSSHVASPMIDASAISPTEATRDLQRQMEMILPHLPPSTLNWPSGQGPQSPDNGPTPPPKDAGYRPRSSAAGPLSIPAGIEGASAEGALVQDCLAALSNGPPPHIAVPTRKSSQRRSTENHDPGYFGRASIETPDASSWTTAGSARPSAEKSRLDSDTSTVPSTQEHKRLTQRRHIIQELLTTENSYHQDLKIIEDIYRATVADFISAEDRKTLFGNCSEVERFSLQFYDAMRKAAAPVYQPPRHVRWSTKRGSESTTQSESQDIVDDTKDRATTIGQCFLDHIQRIDQVYGTYLRNHEAANQRLQALKSRHTVQCWLEECCKNANDITTSWSLDSLLVKPTQRVSKYPLLLQRLLDTTPADHPDFCAIKLANQKSMDLLQRINDAKKRADIVNQIIHGKDKERGGLVKAFGRRHDKIKERVGIAESFQDPEFVELSHKFGSHFIRLQICMRDVQEYVQHMEKAVYQTNQFAMSINQIADAGGNGTETTRWRGHAQAMREVAALFDEHRASVQHRVIQPMLDCISLHHGPQEAMNKRKKRLVDYAKCRTMEQRGEKPDRKTFESSEIYIALNDQLKVELPQLYQLTAQLVRSCLHCFVDIQARWFHTWDRRLRPVADAIAASTPIGEDSVQRQLKALSICNGVLVAEAANIISPSSILLDDSRPSTLLDHHNKYQTSPEWKRPSSANNRSLSVCSDGTNSPFKRHSGDGRLRSASSTAVPQSNPSRGPFEHVTPVGGAIVANAGNVGITGIAGAAGPATTINNPMFTGPTHKTTGPSRGKPIPPIATSSLPHSTTSPSPRSPTVNTPPVQFVCASLYEFSIDKSRQEAGYSYLSYGQGEVFDVFATRGELWLARNQDDPSELGWIWEQHFLKLAGT